MTAPPKNGKGALQAPIPKLTGLPRSNSGVAISQAQWHREAARLFQLYERTLNPRHFRALSRHLRGMRERGVVL